MSKPYSTYKDSGIEWVGAIPQHWSARPLFALFKERDVVNEGNQEDNVLSLSYGRIIRRDVESNFGLLPESFETYNIVEPLDIVLRLTDLQNDKRSLRCGLVKERGIITSAYLTLESKGGVDSEYMFLLLHNYDIWKVFYGMGGGVRQSIKFDDLKRLPMLEPPLEEQMAIKKFLNGKMRQINDLIAKKERMIELLKEERTTIVNQAVTQGLDHNVEMRDSGIDWMVKIPKHWDLKDLKYVSRVNRFVLSETTEEGYEFNYIDIGNVDLDDGFDRGEKIRFDSAPSRARRIVWEGDTIISTVRTYLKSVAHIEGDSRDLIVSTGFAVVTPKDNFVPKFLYYVLRSERFVGRVCALSVGVSYPAINAVELSNVAVWYPKDKKEQQQIVDYLDGVLLKTKNVIGRLQKEIQYLKEYRTALISETVTGKIDVRTS